MSHIFISYSREDKEFASKIVQALAENDLETWIDWQNIPPAEEWLEEIYRGIEAAEAFLFLISPDSLSSEICNKELEHAVENGKRIIPIIIRDPQVKAVPESLSKLNWIFCRDGQDEFEKAIAETRKTVRTDYEWLKFHTELQVKALKWHRSNNEKSLLLRGKELEDSETMMGLKAGLEPHPVDLQREYLLRSRQATDRQRRQISIGLFFGVIVLLITLLFTFLAATERLNRFLYRPLPMEWVEVPAGTFIMGSETGQSDESPTHEVYLDAFEIGKYEITNEQYDQCVRAGVCGAATARKYTTDPNALKEPAVRMQYYDALRFCNWVDPNGRLPNEAEWEKAARGGLEGRLYSWGDEKPTCNHANYNICSTLYNDVGRYKPNGYGIYDMAGNVAEWTDSIYQPYPYSVPIGLKENLLSRPEYQYITIRGGSTYGGPSTLRNSDRAHLEYWNSSEYVGFRCARQLLSSEEDSEFVKKLLLNIDLYSSVWILVFYIIIIRYIFRLPPNLFIESWINKQKSNLVKITFAVFQEWVLMILAALGVIYGFVKGNFPQDYVLYLLIPAGLWVGGAYCHSTRFQSGKLSRIKRVFFGSLAGFLSAFIPTFIVMLLVYTSASEIFDNSTFIGLLASATIILGPPLILGVFGSFLGSLGSFIYIFGIQKRSQKLQVHYKPN
jgi:formylglycine-generating enzyme required for sulfatase activity